MESLLVFDLLDELDGSLHDEGFKPLLEVCLRLLEAPVPDAERAGEQLLVVAHDDGEKISFVIRGAGSLNDYGSLDVGEIEWYDESKRAEFVTAFAATLRLALNGLAQTTSEDEQALAELWRFSQEQPS